MNSNKTHPLYIADRAIRKPAMSVQEENSYTAHNLKTSIQNNKVVSYPICRSTTEEHQNTSLQFS